MTTGSLLDFTGKWIPDLPHSTEHPYTLSAAHPNPNFSTGFHRRTAGFCSILLTFMEIFSRLLGQHDPTMEADEAPWDTAARAISLKRIIAADASSSRRA
jgi:hypothetical protein